MLVRSLVVAGLLVVPTAFSSAQNSFPDTCPGSKPLPFTDIAVKHPIDGVCGLEGKPSSPAPSHLQNSVKNNFCGDSSSPETFTPQMLIQAKTHLPSGQSKEPADRQPLTELGEGKIVRMKANLLEAHYADLGGGESVNCNGPNEVDNDIHIAFGAKANTKECSSVSGEISPHFRPDSWAQIGNFETYNSKTRKYTVNPKLASRLQAHPYRITGQLFFDSSHAPCPCGTTCNPIRASVWEIHPIYKIEVCRTKSCDVNSDSDWVAFDTWWDSLVPVQPTKPPHTHTPHESGPKKKGGTPGKKTGNS
jgi:hypothetical protein